MKVLIIDDDNLVAVSLKTIIEADEDISVCATGSSGEEAIKLFDEHKPDVLLMDIRMKGITGIEAGEVILKKYNHARILYLTTFSDDEYILKAISIGAKGYIIKQDFDAIVPALKTVYGGQTVFGTEVISKLPNMINYEEDKSSRLSEFDLTKQELEIVECVAEGLSNKEIATKLYLSEGTVRNYISNILTKLDLRDRTNLAIFYYKNN